MNETNENIDCENHLNLLKKIQKIQLFPMSLTKQIFLAQVNVFLTFIYVCVCASVCWFMYDLEHGSCQRITWTILFRLSCKPLPF